MKKKTSRTKSVSIPEADLKKINASKKIVDKLHKAALLAKAKYKAAKKALKLAKKDAKAKAKKSNGAPVVKKAIKAKSKKKKVVSVVSAPPAAPGPTASVTLS